MCSATYHLNDTETSLTIQRFKAKFSWVDEGTDALITWTEHFVPDIGAPVDTAKSFHFTTGDTPEHIYEVMEPATNGVITIINVSCVPVDADGNPIGTKPPTTIEY